MKPEKQPSPEGVAAPAPPGSISGLIPSLKAGNQQAVQALWERYFQPLVRVAAARLDPKVCRAQGADDIAQVAFLELCASLTRPDAVERFPRLQNRDNLWKLLVCFTVRAAFDFNQKARRQAEIVGGESALGQAGLAQCAGRQPVPEFSAAVAELLEQLGDESLQRVALLKMAGHTNEEIARQIGRAVTTVELKLKRIRAIWQELNPEVAR